MSESCIPSNHRHRTKSESCICSKIIRRSSQQFSSIENLESLITCSIHLGLIDEARQLTCGHAFCYSCLKNYINNFSKSEDTCVLCPLCRSETALDANGLDTLAPSVVHKQLTEYLILKRQKVIENSVAVNSDSTTDSRENVNDVKLTLMRHLMKDLENEISSNDESDLEQQLNLILGEHSDQMNTPKTRSLSLSESAFDKTASNVNSNTFEAYNHLDQNSIRKNMRKYREYKLIKSFTHPKQSSIVQVSWINRVGTVESGEDAEVMIYIIKDCSLVFFSNLEGTKIRHVSLDLDGHCLCPVFVKGLRDEWLAVGSDNDESVLIKMTLIGVVLNVSAKYPGKLGGFCLDEINDTIIVAYPSNHAVLVLDFSTLSKIRMFYFDDLSPMFVAKSTNFREIWVSCPDNGRIAVYDELEGNYHHLDTSQIYESLPTHINETRDHRIVFLDSSWNRIFWIRRWNNQLYIQLLLVIGVNDEMTICSVEPMPENMISLSSNRWTCIAKPTRSVKDEHRKDKCTLF